MAICASPSFVFASARHCAIEAPGIVPNAVAVFSGLNTNVLPVRGNIIARAVTTHSLLSSKPPSTSVSKPHLPTGYILINRGVRRPFQDACASLSLISMSVEWSIDR